MIIFIIIVLANAARVQAELCFISSRFAGVIQALSKHLPSLVIYLHADGKTPINHENPDCGDRSVSLHWLTA
jgi:hypothetical protein